MLGEYVLFSRGKSLTLICDNKLFINPTADAKAFIKVEMAT